MVSWRFVRSLISPRENTNPHKEIAPMVIGDTLDRITGTFEFSKNMGFQFLIDPPFTTHLLSKDYSDLITNPVSGSMLVRVQCVVDTSAGSIFDLCSCGELGLSFS